MSELTDLQLLILEKERIACHDVEELLDDYVEESLPVSVKARVDAHIRHCSYCQDLERDYRLTIELAAELGRQDQQETVMSVEVQNRLRKVLNEKLSLNMTML